MRPETRRAALRAASLVAGLSGTVTGATACAPASPPEAQTVPVSEVPRKDVSAAANGAGMGAGAGAGADPTPSLEQCVRIVNDAFPDGDRYPFDPNLEVAPVVRACCAQAMASRDARASNVTVNHRWACCGATAKLPIATGSMCIPWGPPVPPPMARRARISGCSRAGSGAQGLPV